MIHESWPWKQDLLSRKRLILNYNTPDHFSENDERTYTVIEKAIFYSAFIVRKLIDCPGKLSDEAERYQVPVRAFKPLKKIDILNRWLGENSHNWGNAKNHIVRGKDICNWLIHSFIFSLEQDENECVTSFYVSSDYDRNRVLYNIELAKWIAYIDFVGTDSVCKAEICFDKKKGERVYTLKSRYPNNTPL